MENQENKSSSKSSSRKINGIEIEKMKTTYLIKTIKQFTIITVGGLVGVIAIAIAIAALYTVLNDTSINTMSFAYFAFVVIGVLAIVRNFINLKLMKRELNKRTVNAQSQNELNATSESDTTAEKLTEFESETEESFFENVSRISQKEDVAVPEGIIQTQDAVVSESTETNEKGGYNLTAREMQLMAINAGCLESTAGNGWAGFNYIADALRPEEKVVFCIATGPINGIQHSLGNSAIVLTDARLIFAGGTSDFIKTVSSFSLDFSRIDAIDIQASIMAYNLLITSAGEQIKCTFAAMKDQRGSDYLRSFINAIYDCKQAKSEANQTTNIINQVSAADEIKKFKDLLDCGVITQEEFDAKKKELLGL